MIFMSLITCVASAVALVVVAGETKYGLYAGAGIYIIVNEQRVLSAFF
jgi:hypothetical protein